MKTYLITGGLGFIPFTLAQKLLTDPENKVLIIDDGSAGGIDVDVQLIRRAYEHRLEIEVGDLRFTDLPDCDGVYHMAAHIGTKSQHDDPLYTINDNITLMQVVLDRYMKTNTKIVYSSTIEVYTGRHQTQPTPEACPVGWDNPRDPRWAYSFGKFVAEMLLTSSKATYSVARFSNVYGPRMCHDYVVKSLFKRIAAKESPLLVHSPNDTRPLIYVDDVVEGLICLMNNPVANGHIFNIGSNIETKIADLYRLGVEIANADLEVIDDVDVQIESRLPDITKAKELLGWYPKTSLREGLLKTWEYYGKKLG